VVDRCAELGLGSEAGLAVTLLVPESLILTATTAIRRHADGRAAGLSVGCQGVYREDVEPGGNFGAFTSNLPASAAAAMGCTWAMVGHSEERRDKLGVIASYAPATVDGDGDGAGAAVDTLIGAEAARALEAGMGVLLCVGETDDQRSRVREVLDRQITLGLEHAAAAARAGRVVIGYEPVWAIGPGMSPPQAGEIGEIAGIVGDITARRLGVAVPVVYGGGLKEENAAAIGGRPEVSGGLVALTRFTGQIGFDPDDLARIVAEFRGRS
jgi:triosephosphate isomerase